MITTRHELVTCILVALVGVVATGCYDAKLQANVVGGSGGSGQDPRDRRDGGAGDIERDAGALDDGGKSDADAKGGSTNADKPDADVDLPTYQHPECPLPSHLPRDGKETPQFSTTKDLGSDEERQPEDMNAWESVSCSDVADWPRCDASLPCPFDGRCIFPIEGELGICVHARVECEVPLRFHDGQCDGCVPAREKAAACCLFKTGVECRHWPFEESAKPGETCLTNDDCESGLECQLPRDGDTYVGLCACPGAARSYYANGPACGSASEPASWGGEDDLYYTCNDGPAPGWIDGDLMRGERLLPLDITVDPNGKLHVFPRPDPWLVDVSNAGNAPPDTTGTRNVWDDAFKAYERTIQRDPVSLTAKYASNGSLYVFTREAASFSRSDFAWYAQGEWLERYLNEARAWDFGFDASGGLHMATVSLYGDGEMRVSVGLDQPELIDERVLGTTTWSRVSLVIDAAQRTHVFGSDFHSGSDWSFFGVGAHYVEDEAGDFTSTDLPGVTSAVAVPDGGVLAVADTSTWQEGSSVSLYHIAADGSVRTERLWTQESLRFRIENTEPKLAVSPDGSELAVVHRSPEGLMLALYRDDAWESMLLRAKLGPTWLVYDVAGELHVFYVYETYDQRLRHVRRGTCPTSPNSPPSPP